MRRVVQDGVVGRSPLGGSGGGFAGVQIAIEAWEIAAGKFQSNAMPRAKHVAGGPQIDGERIDLAGYQQRRSFLRFAILCPKNPFGNVERGTVGKYIHEFRGEV